jgi:hypothetical protein
MKLIGRDTVAAPQQVNADSAAATPFVVNERPIEGALPLADFRRVLDAALLLEKSTR